MNFFEAQARARRSTRWLVVAYLVATVLIVAGVTLIVAAALHMVGDVREPAQPPVLVATAVLAALLIAGATLYKTAALSAGGGRVAMDMGGTLIPPDIKDPLRRRLRNVVEEMAIASGVLAPEVYVLEAEPGINAFAAGTSPGDAAIAVTRGALETLDRDELQGVIAHEFSHILNGDMRLNVRMIGVLFGIMVLSIIGRMILRGSYHGRAMSMRRNRNASFVLILGAGLALLGWMGVFFARLIKAGVSRQRESLADASAVQFTRQTQGLANALKKIGGYTEHSWFHAADPEEVSHMLFARGSRRLTNLFATHPPLEARIRALDPSFREGDYPRVEARTTPLANEAQGVGGAAAAVAGLHGGAVADRVASPGPGQIELAGRLRRSIPIALYDAAHSQEDAWLLAVALALHQEEQHRERQLAVVGEQLGRDRAMRIRRFDEALRELGSAYYLPLLDIAFPALRRRPAAQLEFLLGLIRRLVELDHRVELREYCFMKVLAGNLGLDPSRSGKSRPTRMSREDAKRAAVTLLRLAAEQGAGDDRARGAALAAGLAALGMAAAGDPARPAVTPGVNELDSSLALLQRLKPPDKKRLVEGLAATVLADRLVSTRESEILRAVCAALDCPLPPLEPGAPGNA